MEEIILEPFKIAMINDDTLEMFDPAIKKQIFLPKMVIAWLNLCTDELLNTINDYHKILQDKKNTKSNIQILYDVGNSYNNETRITDFFFNKLVGISLQEVKKSHDRQYAMEQYAKYILDVFNPFQLLSKSIIMHKAAPLDIFGFKAHVTYSLFTDGINVNDVYDFVNFQEFLQFAVIKVFRSKIVIKECANCGKLFIPTSRSDEIYCDSVTNQGTRTCKQVGYENKDEFTKAYRTAYKTKNALKNRSINNNQHAKDDFKKWVYAAKIKLGESQSGIITFEEFKKWLKQK